jgi:hypothetical protein
MLILGKGLTHDGSGGLIHGRGINTITRARSSHDLRSMNDGVIISYG